MNMRRRTRAAPRRATRRLRDGPDRRPAGRAGAGARRGAVRHQGAGAVRQQGAAAHAPSRTRPRPSATRTGIRTRRWPTSRPAAPRRRRRQRAAAAGISPVAAARQHAGRRGRPPRRRPARPRATRRPSCPGASRRRSRIAPQSAKPGVDPFIYFVQVGAFSKPEDAEAAARQAGDAGLRRQGDRTRTVGPHGVPRAPGAVPRCATRPKRRRTSCSPAARPPRWCAWNAEPVARARPPLRTRPEPRKERPMNRRDFDLRLGSCRRRRPACRAGAGPGRAGRRQGLRAPGAAGGRCRPPGKIEVVEFFCYWCPHCNSFEPALEAWVRKLPADVAFRRVPVAFSAPRSRTPGSIYALEAMGQLEAHAPQGVRRHPRAAPAPGQRQPRSPPS